MISIRYNHVPTNSTPYHVIDVESIDGLVVLNRMKEPVFTEFTIDKFGLRAFAVIESVFDGYVNGARNILIDGDIHICRHPTRSDQEKQNAIKKKNCEAYDKLVKPLAQTVSIPEGEYNTLRNIKLINDHEHNRLNDLYCLMTGVECSDKLSTEELLYELILIAKRK